MPVQRVDQCPVCHNPLFSCREATILLMISKFAGPDQKPVSVQIMAHKLTINDGGLAQPLMKLSDDGFVSKVFQMNAYNSRKKVVGYLLTAKGYDALMVARARLESNKKRLTPIFSEPAQRQPTTVRRSK